MALIEFEKVSFGYPEKDLYDNIWVFTFSSGIALLHKVSILFLMMDMRLLASTSPQSL